MHIMLSYRMTFYQLAWGAPVLGHVRNVVDILPVYPFLLQYSFE